MSPGLFEEMKRYLRFEADDEAALRQLLPWARPAFVGITERFYQRLAEHEEARKVLEGPEQIARLRESLRGWLELLLSGPWDEAYCQRRARIGRMHVNVGLPQRYMFGALGLIRLDLLDLAERTLPGREERQQTTRALSKILDLELAIMLESYREAFVERVQELERLEKEVLKRRLALSEARYDEVVEKADALVVTLDASGRILLFNGRCEELTGIRRSEAVGRPWVELFTSPPDPHVLRERLGAMQEQGSAPAYDGVVQRADGETSRVRWHFTTLPGAGQSVLCAIGIDTTQELPQPARNGHTGRTERLATLGTMAAGLAHEIRNPLNAAHLQLTLTQRRLARPSGPDVAGAIEAAELVAREMRRLARIVEEFLDFARPHPLELVRGDLRETARSVMVLMAQEATATGVELRLLGEAPVEVELDNERLKQVLVNLVRNGIEAAGRGGQVEVRVGTEGGQAVLEVIDDGPGLPSLDAPIFEPFWTTKPGGTGLGLSIVHRVVRDHGGQVTVESRPGRTSFVVHLPLIAPLAGQAIV